MSTGFAFTEAMGPTLYIASEVICSVQTDKIVDGLIKGMAVIDMGLYVHTVEKLCEYRQICAQFWLGLG